MESDVPHGLVSTTPRKRRRWKKVDKVQKRAARQESNKLLKRLGKNARDSISPWPQQAQGNWRHYSPACEPTPPLPESLPTVSTGRFIQFLEKSRRSSQLWSPGTRTRTTRTAGHSRRVCNLHDITRNECVRSMRLARFRFHLRLRFKFGKDWLHAKYYDEAGGMRNNRYT